jgi:hypothetical protein
MNIKFDWEIIYGVPNLSESDGGNTTARARVPGGWLVRCLCWCDNNHVQSESMIFLPDKKHEWEIAES